MLRKRAWCASSRERSVRWHVRMCAHANAGYSLGAAAGTSDHGRAPRERAVSLAQSPFIWHGPPPPSAEPRERFAIARGAPPPKREACGGTYAQESCLLEAAASTSEHGRAPRERVSLAQWASVRHEPFATSAKQCARAASARGAPPPERVREVVWGRVRTRERRLLIGGSSWHVGVRSCTEGEGRLAAVVDFHQNKTDSNQRGAARAHRKRA